MIIGVGVSCHILYSVVSYLYASFSGQTTSAEKETAYFSAIVYLLCGFWSEGSPLPLGA